MDVRPDPEELQNDDRPQPPDASFEPGDWWEEGDKPPDRGAPGWASRISSPTGLLVLGLASLALLAAAIGGWLWLRASLRQGQQAPVVTPVSIQALITEYPELANILQDPNLDSAYKDFLLVYQTGGGEAALELAEKRGLLNANGDLRLTLELETTDTAPLQAELEANGILVTAVSGNLMDIAIPLEMLESMMMSGGAEDLLSSITNLPQIRRIRLPKMSVGDQAGVMTESVVKIGASDWQAAGITGRGVKVGILDLGFDRYRELLGTDLPVQVTVQSFIAGKEADQAGTPHGTAVAEIIHDIAPDAELFFAAYETDVEEREAVEWLLSQGVQIISHSAGALLGPMDGTTDEARWVDSIVANGVLWVNSSGNSALTHYRATFTDTDGDGYHEFSPGDELMGFIPDETVLLVVNWDDWTNGTQDLDLYVYDPNGNDLASSTNIQDGPGDYAAEGVRYTFPDTRTYYLAIVGKRVTRPVTIDFFMHDGLIEYSTPEHSLTTPGDSIRALTVGAVDWSTEMLEDYSGQGPTNDNRLKPEISAPTGVTSTAFEGSWIGTSASAPHVSGAAALVLQAFPNYTPDQVRDFLLSRAVDAGPSGPDNGYGYGKLALGQAPDLASLIVATATPLPEPTATQAAAVPGVTNTPAPTPTLVVNDLPKPETEEESSAGLILGLLACVIAPAVLGLGGIGLVVGVWYISRRKPPSPGPGGYYPPGRGVGGQRRVPPPQGGAPRRPPAPPPGAASAICPRCSSVHRPDARFCPVCGLALSPELYHDAGPSGIGRPPQANGAPPAAQPTPPVAPPPAEKRFCNQCGAPLRPESKFCSNCGAPR